MDGFQKIVLILTYLIMFLYKVNTTKYTKARVVLLVTLDVMANVLL
jgi:hypothetical protein